MEKKKGLKLRLDKETLQRLELLDSPELRGIVGGCDACHTEDCETLVTCTVI